MLGYLWDRRVRAKDTTHQRLHNTPRPDGEPVFYTPFRFADAEAEVRELHAVGLHEVNVFCGNSAVRPWIRRFQRMGLPATGGPWPFGGGRVAVMRPRDTELEVGE